MDEAQLRIDVARAAQQLWLQRLIQGDQGFISAELNRRRFIATPPAIRRANLRPEHTLCVDLGGLDTLTAHPPIPEQLWRPHRLTYQSAAYLEAEGAYQAREIHATVLANPPRITALHRLNPQAEHLTLQNQPDIPVIDADNDPALQQTVLNSSTVFLRGQGLLVADRSVDACLNQLETVEHLATLQLALTGHNAL